ncbi:DUF5336 domain-containing protein [Mycolicibacter sp. MYC123]|uniref:DUF5336 domain-containing protein n=1 Tax=[Mycobacterium] zoologicum TaxID=2872311 RepID=A0ABU5YKW7_9MYCO|nr:MULTISPECIES: DUF5336 domain-containing protein [unclassified Mycolicibacter]MEB3050687.1 DUF5336 domain-containing protein [Mycolicibacter sp. MYC123]MEB3062798.1 DUF5336 domain-containing protein [Mycolicibacter sp. MYC101]
MTYSPGTPGFQSSQPPGSFGPSTPSFTKTADAESKLPLYLRMAVAVLGLGVYLANFGPIVTVSNGEYPLILGDAGHTVPLALLAGLLAGAALLPKVKSYTTVVAVISTLGALLAIATLADAGDDYTVGWGLWLVLTFSILQAAAAVGVLLLETGVVTAPAPRPKYDPYGQYGLPPGGNYYGQQAPQQPGYPSYGGYPSAPSSGGFGAQSGPASSGMGSMGGFGTASQPTQSVPSMQQGPPTPPTGFPSFSPPPSSGSGSSSTAGSGGSGGSGQGSTGGQQAQGGSAPSGPAQP